MGEPYFLVLEGEETSSLLLPVREITLLARSMIS